MSKISLMKLKEEDMVLNFQVLEKLLKKNQEPLKHMEILKARKRRRRKRKKLSIRWQRVIL